MKNFVARAMQISCMDKIQINELHEIESKRLHCLPNWNIQTLFGLGSLKDLLGIPYDETAQAVHSQRLDNEITKAGYTKIEMSEETMILDSYKWTHAFDLVVHRNHMDINFNYSGPKNIGNITARLSRTVRRE